MIEAHFTRRFSAAHRVWNDPGACSNIHGHNYLVDIYVEHERLNEQGFVIPFDAIKGAVDHFDHSLIVHDLDPLMDQLLGLGVRLTVVAAPPSTEHLCASIAQDVFKLLPFGGKVRAVLREGDGIEATAIWE